MRASALFAILLAACACGLAAAEPKVQVTGSVPRQDISLTVYNPNVTLVQEKRVLTLGEGANEFRVTWGGVNLDRSSVRLDPLPGGEGFALRDLLLLDSDPNTVVWHLNAKRAGAYPVSVSYFVSGLSWSADHTITLSPDEKTLTLDTAVTIANQSGESYQDAKLRLALGELRFLPGVPGPRARGASAQMGLMLGDTPLDEAEGFSRRGMSEYTFYTLERPETLDSGEAKRIQLAQKTAIPARRIYLYDDRSFGNNVALQYWFDNKGEYKLGILPPGRVRAFRRGADGQLTLLGEDMLTYLPVGETAKLYLGNARNLLVEPKQTEYQRSDEQFARDGALASYVETAEQTVTVKNRRSEPVELVLRQYLPSLDTVLLDATPAAESPEAGALEWKLKLPAGAEEKLVYHIRRKVIVRGPQ